MHLLLVEIIQVQLPLEGWVAPQAKVTRENLRDKPVWVVDDDLSPVGAPLNYGRVGALVQDFV